MESRNRSSKSQDDGNLLLSLYTQLKDCNSTADRINIQSKINCIIAQNFLLYTNGSNL